MPLISGGDRHCCEPNANVNLTNAGSFAEFVQEIREDQRSAVLFLTQYRDPISVRCIEFTWHATRDYPEFPGRSRWLDRVFYRRDSGETVTIGSLWPNGGPAAVRTFVAAIKLLADPRLRAVHCMAVGRLPKLEPEIV